MLLDKGYIKHILNCKTMKYEVAKDHTISTMVNLDHRYIHSTDAIFLNKIASGKSVMDDDFTWEDIKAEICFGLHEVGKPPTLVFPRPKIEVKRIKDGRVVVENETYDDSMNVVLKDITCEEIFKAMFDENIVIKIDLT